MMKRMLLVALILLFAGYSFAQQPQTSLAPVQRLNAQYTNGVAPGYWPTAGSGLTLNLSAGTVNCTGTITTYAAGTLSMTNNTTNYVYLNVSSSCAPATKTTAFAFADIPIATVVTSGGNITTITDDRTPFFTGSIRSCDIAVGDSSGSVITNTQLGPQKRICKIPLAATVIEIDVSADAGTPNVIVGRSRCTTWTSNVCTAETRVNFMSGALSVATGGFDACINSGGTTGLDGGTLCSSGLTNASLSGGDYIELVSGTAGGTAKLMTIHVIYTLVAE